VSENTRTYNLNEVVSFRSTKQSFGGLSNMASGYVIKVNDIIISSSEALYQACRYPHLPDVQELILSERNPMLAKRISKQYYAHTRPDWNSVRFKVMYWCLQVKLSQNWERFYKELVSTGNKAIVEYAKEDKVWAACPIGNGQLQGTNALGRLLMQLREECIFKGEFLDCVEPPEIENFLLFGHQIDVVCNPAVELEDGYIVSIA
jgi:ribA/ribD-fused uncharacterized protein